MACPTVRRYDLPELAEGDDPIFEFDLPIGAEVIGVHLDRVKKRVALFAIIDPDATRVRRRFVAVEAEERLPRGAGFVATFQAGVLFWHVFEIE